MGSIRARAVLKISKPTDHQNVMMRAKIVTDDMEKNSSYFPNPIPTIAAIREKMLILKDLISDVNSGNYSVLEQRNSTSKKLYRMLQQEVLYVNLIADGRIDILEKSGFIVIKESLPKSAPGQVFIKRIIDGLHPNTAKIYIHPLSITKLTFFVEISKSNSEEAIWIQILKTTNSSQLIIPDMIHGEEVWFRVSASNSHGQGLWSNPSSFICRS